MTKARAKATPQSRQAVFVRCCFESTFNRMLDILCGAAAAITLRITVCSTLELSGSLTFVLLQNLTEIAVITETDIISYFIYHF